MDGITLRTGDNRTIGIAPVDIEKLSSRLRGRLLTRNDAGYDDACRIWNAMIDREPALIAQCETVDDVVQMVNFAREHGALLAIRGGGHNIAGNALCDDGVVIDLSPMREVRIDRESRTARVQPGATLADVDRETQTLGLATPLGINSTTGVAGLTLGGGFGWRSRSLGLTIDNLLSADVVTAQGELVRASEDENADLFWGIRGGGGNFGVVTSFEFRLFEVGPEILSGLVIHPLADAPQVLRFYRDFLADAPDELAGWFVMRKAPPLPFLPAEWHGREILVLAMVFNGDVAEGERVMAPLRGFGKPIADVVAPHPYTAWQQILDPLLTPGARNYWKSHDFRQLGDELIDVVIQYAEKIPDPQCEIAFAQLGGAVSRVPAAATAYGHRDAEFVMNVHGRWSEPGKDDECTTWARSLFRDAAPYATGAVYVNFLTGEETERVRAAYGDNYDRLVELKTRWDPSNLFRVNQNIQPATPTPGFEPTRGTDVRERPALGGTGAD